VSPIIANLFMVYGVVGATNNSCSASELYRPRLWKRFVDDTLEVIKKRKCRAAYRASEFGRLHWKHTVHV